MMGEYDAGYENCIDAMVRQMEDMQFRIDSLHRENGRLRNVLAEFELDRCPHCPNLADLVDSLAEKEKLREEVDECKAALNEAAGKWAKADEQNRKLADLVADMLVTVRAAGRLGVDVGKVEEYGRRVHELGIEVYG